MSEDDEIARARERVAMGSADAIDLWRVRQAERREGGREQAGVEVAELRGQVKALTAERSRIWRPGDAT